MQAGQHIAGRFEVEGVAGSGGMGTVWRAIDRVSGATVAVKTLRDPNPTHIERFVREATLLSEFTHPGVVSYVAHGATESGDLYLAMEWLEGEDLAVRLRREALSPAEAVLIAGAMARILEAAHAHGIVHRDIKPSNIFLVDRDPRQLKLLDFGVARLTRAVGLGSTQTGMMIGTPGYMSPEQARGERTVDGRADLFSLGCVLYECLVGEPPFVAEHPIAVLAKILLDDAPRLADARPDLSAELDALLASLLAKQVAERISTAREVHLALDALGSMEGASRPIRAQPSKRVLTSGERRLCSVVLAGRPDTWARLSSGVTARGDGAGSEEPTRAMGQGSDLREHQAELTRMINQFGGLLDFVGDGALVVTHTGSGVVTDQVARAARSALAIRRCLPDLPVAVATGRGVVTDRWPLGEVIDRSAALLAGSSQQGSGAGVSIDALTAGLLGPLFECEGPPESPVLLRERSGTPGSGRRLLGKVTPFVGRQRELARLQDAIAEAIEEPVAKVLLVTAPPGVGKTRLHDELMATLGGGHPEASVWSARGDPVRSGSPFLLARQLLRQAAGSDEAAPPEVVQRGLTDLLASLPGISEADRIARFLGELAGAPWVEDHHLQLEAARADAGLMSDQLRRAWDDLLQAASAVRPTLVILDDLHWGDLPSVRLLDGSLRRLRDRPFLVLAFARPAVHERFADLWKERGLEEVQLRELSKKAALQLARTALGEGAPEPDLERLVSLSDGNVLHLEELIREWQQHASSLLPATVVAMIEARIEALDLPLRRLLRAASIFGIRFSRGGIAALLGESPETVEGSLHELVGREWVEPAAGGAQQYQFRHALAREAAAAMLTESDAALGHRLAGEWLESSGERDALLLADHFAQGGERVRAAQYLAQAAEDALAANDLDAAIERAQRGIELGAEGEVLGELSRVEAEAWNWRMDNERALAASEVALAHCPRSSDSWYRAAVVAAQSMGRLARLEPLAQLARELLVAGGAEAPPASFVVAAVRVSWPLYTTGNTELGDALLGVAESMAAGIRDDGRVKAALQVAGATRTMLAGEIESWMTFEGMSAQAFLALGDVRRACEARGSQGYALIMLGAYDEAISALKRAVEEAQSLGIAGPEVGAQQNLGWAEGRSGRREPAIERLRRCCRVYLDKADRRLEGGTRLYLALFLVEDNRLDEAVVELDQADRLLEAYPPLRIFGRAIRAGERLARGDTPQAVALSAQAARELDDLGVVEEGEAYVRWMHAQALWVAGERAEALRIAEAAWARVLAQAERIFNPALRDSFLNRVPEHLSLAKLLNELRSG